MFFLLILLLDSFRVFYHENFRNLKFTKLLISITVEPRCDEGPRDWQNLFAIPRFRYIEVLFHTFYYYWSKENCSLYRGLRHIEVRYIEVPLYAFERPSAEKNSFQVLTCFIVH